MPMRALVSDRVGVPDVLPDGTDLTPYKHLAAAVLQAALRDANGSPASPNTTEARRFLSGNSPLLQHWCRLANVSQAQLLALARRRRWGAHGKNGRRAGPFQRTSR